MTRATATLTVLLVALSTPAFSQKITATLRGTVTDTTGAVVPGVSVTAKIEQTGFARTTPTNSAGVYSFAEMPTGTYTIEAALSGFKSSVVRGVILNVADVRAVDLRLE